MKKALKIIGIILIIAFIGALIPDDSASDDEKKNPKPVQKVEQQVSDKKEEKEESQQDQQEVQDKPEEQEQQNEATTPDATQGETGTGQGSTTSNFGTQQNNTPNNNVSVTVPTYEDTTGNLVWVPVNGGTKYHSDSSCSKMKDPKQVTKEHAEANGYTACKRCY